MAGIDSTATTPEERTIKVGADAFNHATLLLGRVYGLLDLMFTLSCTDDELEGLCQGTMVAALDTAMAQVREARDLLVNTRPDAAEVSYA